MQLDPRMPRSELLRRLRLAADKIEYWQRENQKASRAHIKRRYRKLRTMGIFVSKIRKCYNAF
jgi:hypothetical protein